MQILFFKCVDILKTGKAREMYQIKEYMTTKCSTWLQTGVCTKRKNTINDTGSTDKNGMQIIHLTIMLILYLLKLMCVHVFSHA